MTSLTGRGCTPYLLVDLQLEKEAEDAGGKVTFLIGNHETMVLGNDLRYTKKKYTQLADTLGMSYRSFGRKASWTLVENS